MLSEKILMAATWSKELKTWKLERKDILNPHNKQKRVVLLTEVSSDSSPLHNLCCSRAEDDFSCSLDLLEVSKVLSPSQQLHWDQIQSPGPENKWSFNPFRVYTSFYSFNLKSFLSTCTFEVFYHFFEKDNSIKCVFIIFCDLTGWSGNLKSRRWGLRAQGFKRNNMQKSTNHEGC